MRRVLVTTTTTITFMVAFATAIPPPPPPMSEPPPPISTPPPPRCRLEDGSEVEGLVPGGTVFRGCDFCECSWDGSEARCYLIHCEPPRCADPEEGECCPTCPNGENCRTPTGTIIKDGETVTLDSMTCTCSVAGYTRAWWEVEPGDAPEAECMPFSPTPTPLPAPTPTPTPPPTPPLGCRMEDDTVLQPGEEWTSPGGCKICYCYEGSEEASCIYADCMGAPCVNPVSKPGVCCSTCPDGSNCRTPSGKIINDGETVMEDGMLCSCDYESELTFGYANTEAQCLKVEFPTTPPPPTTAAPTCRAMDRITIQFGQTWTSSDGCTSCHCVEGSEYAFCEWTDCVVPPCADPVPSPNSCCKTCPNGENCQVASGEIIAKGETLKKDGAVCFCRRKEASFGYSLEAVCIPMTTLKNRIRRLKRKLRKSRETLSTEEIRRLRRRIRQLERQLN